MTNNVFIQKMISDELSDTLFFSTGEPATRDRSNKQYWVLSNSKIRAEIYNYRKIKINGIKCFSVSEAKYTVQKIIFDIN